MKTDSESNSAINSEAMAAKGAKILLISGILGVIGMSLFPAAIDPVLFQDERALLTAISGNSLLVYAHFGMIGVFLSLLLGIVLVTGATFRYTLEKEIDQTLPTKGLIPALGAILAAIVAVCLGILFMLVDGMALAEISMKYTNAGTDTQELVYQSAQGLLALDNALFNGTCLAWGITNIALAKAMQAADRVFPRWLSNTQLGGGILLLLTSILYFVLFFTTDLSLSDDGGMEPYYWATSINFIAITGMFAVAALVGWKRMP